VYVVISINSFVDMRYLIIIIVLILSLMRYSYNNVTFYSDRNRQSTLKEKQNSYLLMRLLDVFVLFIHP